MRANNALVGAEEGVWHILLDNGCLYFSRWGQEKQNQVSLLQDKIESFSAVGDGQGGLHLACVTADGRLVHLYYKGLNWSFYYIDLDKGLVHFDMWDFQEKMIKTFSENRFVINLLPRQMGKTITVAAFLLHYAIFNKHKSIGILANKAATSREILGRIQRMLENLPFFLQPGVVEYNKGNVEFGNGSTLMAAATSSDSIRGFSFNVVYLDEFAFVENADTFYTSTYPVISSGSNTKVLITSTPNGMNLFYKLWEDARMGRNDFVPVKVHWSENPKRDNKWKETTLKNIGKRQFQQEYECAFHGSSGTLISGEKLAELVWQEPIQETENTKIYERVKKGHSYLINVDVGEGVGSDFSVINVTDITTQPYKQVMVYRSNEISPMVLPEYVERFAKEYNLTTTEQLQYLPGSKLIDMAHR